MTKDADLFDNLRIELRSGCLVVAALAQLRSEHYGYSLRKALADASLEIEESTLSAAAAAREPRLADERVARRGTARKKRFYRLSSRGERVLDGLLVEWAGINRAIARLVRKGNHDAA